MTKQTINNGETLGVIRGKLNSNDSELYDNMVTAADVLTKNNTVVYTPTANYHPTTKLYTDQLWTNWHAVYNPQSIDADVFDRDNHTGTLAPAVINTDTNNRFVSDAEKATWNSKEDAIGTKNTAFNKNFGTVAGTVAYGDHTHNKSEIGLGNVDNTSDLNKPVSTAQQTALDGKLNKTVAEFTPQISAPTHAEGKVYYDDDYHALAIQNDISGSPYRPGISLHMRVVNKTGSTIAAGRAVRHDGVDVTTGLPKIIMAQADTVEHAQVLGITYNAINNDAVGLIAIAGPVNSFDTTSYPVGVPLYLSDTVAGDYSSTPPDIVTQVGGVLTSDPSGRMQVSIVNLLTFPVLLGILQTLPDTYTLSGTGSYEDMDNYSVNSSVGLPVVASTGRMTLPNTGWYRLTLNVTITLTAASPGGDVVNFRLYNVTQSTVAASTTVTVTSAVLTESRSFTIPFYASSNDQVVMQVGSADSSADLTFGVASFDIESVHIN